MLLEFFNAIKSLWKFQDHGFIELDFARFNMNWFSIVIIFGGVVLEVTCSLFGFARTWKVRSIIYIVDFFFSWRLEWYDQLFQTVVSIGLNTWINMVEYTPQIRPFIFCQQTLVYFLFKTKVWFKLTDSYLLVVVLIKTVHIFFRLSLKFRLYYNLLLFWLSFIIYIKL